MDELAAEIEELLSIDAERFEAIYYYVNEIPYINLNPEMKPIHEMVEDFPVGNHTPSDVAQALKLLTQNGKVAPPLVSGAEWPSLTDWYEIAPK